MSDRTKARLLLGLWLGAWLPLAAPASASTPADTLVMAKNIDDMISLDPAECYELTGVEVDSNIYDRLIRNDPKDVTKLVGGVAESWTVSPDGKTMTFKLRPGLTFVSGKPVTAEDAAFSLSRVIKLDKSPAFLISQLGWTKDNVDTMVKAVDPSTLQITIGPNYAPSLVLALMSSIVGSVVEKAAVMEHDQGGDLGNGWLKAHSAGSGPFSLRSWKANESVVLDANPTYREGAPPMKRVVIRHVPEPAAQRLLIEKGDADIARDLTPDQVASIAGNKDVKIVASPQAALHYVGINVKAAPLNNAKVREALHDLVDYEGMANSFLKGQYQVHQTFWPSGFWAALDKNPYRFDPGQGEAAARGSRLSERLRHHARCLEFGALHHHGAIDPVQHGAGRRAGHHHPGRAEVRHHQVPGAPASVAADLLGAGLHGSSHQCRQLRAQHGQFRQSSDEASGVAQFVADPGDQQEDRSRRRGARHGQARANVQGSATDASRRQPLHHHVPGGQADGGTGRC